MRQSTARLQRIHQQLYVATIRSAPEIRFPILHHKHVHGVSDSTECPCRCHPRPASTSWVLLHPTCTIIHQQHPIPAATSSTTLHRSIHYPPFHPTISGGPPTTSRASTTQSATSSTTLHRSIHHPPFHPTISGGPPTTSRASEVRPTTSPPHLAVANTAPSIVGSFVGSSSHFHQAQHSPFLQAQQSPLRHHRPACANGKIHRPSTAPSIVGSFVGSSSPFHQQSPLRHHRPACANGKIHRPSIASVTSTQNAFRTPADPPLENAILSVRLKTLPLCSQTGPKKTRPKKTKTPPPPLCYPNPPSRLDRIALNRLGRTSRQPLQWQVAPQRQVPPPVPPEAQHRSQLPSRFNRPNRLPPSSPYLQIPSPVFAAHKQATAALTAAAAPAAAPTAAAALAAAPTAARRSKVDCPGKSYLFVHVSRQMIFLHVGLSGRSPHHHNHYTVAKRP